MMQKTFSDQTYAKKLEEFKAVLAQKVDIDVSKGFPEGRDRIKQICIEKAKLEGALHVKMQELMAPNQQQLQGMMMLERTKMMDTIYVQYNMKINYLAAAVKHYNLEQDPDVIAVQNSFKQQVDQKRLYL